MAKDLKLNIRIYEKIVGLIVFIIALYVYISTMEPTASFWDCGEFIATSYKLQVGHPPGAPFYNLLGKFFSLFAPDKSLVAKYVNSISAISSALTILLLFFTITFFIKRLIFNDKEQKNENIPLHSAIAILGSGFVGSLALTFSDTFWFNAVEAEVYAPSTFLTALTFWLAIKWYEKYDINENYSWRYIILISLIIGISIGVHLLSLLTIPAIAFIIYFKFCENLDYKNILKALILSAFFLLFIMYGIIQGFFKLSGKFELFFVNSLPSFLGNITIPFFTGLFVHVFLVILFFVLALNSANRQDFSNKSIFYYVSFIFLTGATFLVSNMFFSIFLSFLIVLFIKSYKKFYPYFKIVIWSLGMILIGYSTIAVILIRSNANTPLDENNPEDVFSLISYLNREQYGDRPLLYGNTFVSPLDEKEPYKKSEPIYVKDTNLKKYKLIGYKYKHNYAAGFNMIFPRMWSQERNHISAYKSWTNFKGKPINYVNENSEVITIYKPTFFENLKFFLNYQLGWMYFRYFMWNFSGRQNDIQGHGNVMYGNWITGIPFIDNLRLGDQNLLPDYLKNNKGRNKYYMLPFIFGILGLIYHYQKNKKDFITLALFFLMTGVAIIVYLNQTPYQPRERDYSYTGSFYAFCIWISIGAFYLSDLLMKYIKDKSEYLKALAVIFCILISFFSVPFIMAKENWDDHDRSNRYTARDLAYNYLNSCDKNAILFTNGDNDTFPLWYAQEVEGIRTDVRVVNLSLLNTDWYMEQMKWKVYKSDPLPISFTYDEIAGERRTFVPIIEKIKEPIELQDVIKMVKSDKVADKIPIVTGEMINVIKTKNFKLKVDSLTVLNNNIIDKKHAKFIEKELVWSVNKRYLTKSELGILDIVLNTNWKRPIYFAITTGDVYVGLDKFFRVDGLAYKLTPVNANKVSKDQQTGWIDTEVLYNKLMKKFKWGNMDKEDVYLDENNLRMISNIRNLFARLALALLDEGKKDSAIKVLDKCLKITPEKNVPYNLFVLGIIDAYFKAGEIKKGREVLTKLIKNTEQELNYCLGIDESKALTLKSEARRALTVYSELIRISRVYSQNDILKNLEENYKIFIEKFFKLFPQDLQPANDIEEEE